MGKINHIIKTIGKIIKNNIAKIIIINHIIKKAMEKEIIKINHIIKTIGKIIKNNILKIIIVNHIIKISHIIKAIDKIIKNSIKEVIIINHIIIIIGSQIMYIILKIQLNKELII